MIEWYVYFERMKNIDKVYDSYSNALTEFRFLNNKMTEDFCLPIALIHNCTLNQFKIVDKEKDGWQVLVCNARFIFGDQPCTVQKKDKT